MINPFSNWGVVKNSLGHRLAIEARACSKIMECQSLVSCEWLKEQIDQNILGIRVLDGKTNLN